MFVFLLLTCFLWVTSSKVVISEVVPHSDVEDGYYDYIELWNEGKNPQDISGMFLSDSGRDKLKCQLKVGTILQPGEYRSFACQAPTDVVFLPDAACPFRLSKFNDRIYFGKTDNGQRNGVYEALDDMNIGATINRVSNALWATKAKKDGNMQAFPTENFANRYPIVWPLGITEVVWEPVKNDTNAPQWVKVTCLYGHDSFAGSCRPSSRQGLPISIRFETQKDLFSDAGLPTPPSISIPTTPNILVGESYYIVSTDPATFRAYYANDSRITSMKYVIGPWIGPILNTTSGEVFVGLTTKEHSGDYYQERLTWKPNGDDGWRDAKNGGITKLSKFSIVHEPDNWIGLGKDLKCDLDAEFPQSDCPQIDACTANLCVNVSGQGICQYNGLACSHPNFATCYPMTICKAPAPARYNAGCDLTSKVFGHTTADTIAFGFYGDYPEKLWYNEGCVRQPVDCDMTKWSDWDYCLSCDPRDFQNRSRKIKMEPSTNPPGKPCGALFERRSCGDPVNIGNCGPTAAPTEKPTKKPTRAPTPPTVAPTPPTEAPTKAPTPPTVAPTLNPTPPTPPPTPFPTSPPSPSPTKAPTILTPNPTTAPPVEDPFLSRFTDAPLAPPTRSPTATPTTDSPTISFRELVNVTFTFLDVNARHTPQEVAALVRQAIRATTRFMLSERSRQQPTIFKRDEQQVGETWTASIMETEHGTTRQQEADTLAAWLKTQNSQVASIAVVTVAPTNSPTNPTVAPTVPAPTTPFGSPTSSGVDNNGNGGPTYDGLSAGAVIGIIIACLFVLVVIAVIIAVVIAKVAGGNSSNGRYQNM